jgi:peptidoglycan hydrolase-like protein with peptidoglycan-binding domain
MRRTATVVAVVIALAGACTVVWLTTRSSTSAGETSMVKTTTTAKVTTRDLTIYDSTTATLGFTTSVTVSSRASGTVTSLVAPGNSISAGTIVATIDGAPVIAMIGDVPSYRDLSKGVGAGIDVRQLESNLVMLGFDPDSAITIDEVYDSATAAAVTRWEDSIGLTGDGKVTKGEVVFLSGNVLTDAASTTVGAGVNAGSPLVQGRQTNRSFLVTTNGGTGGTIDSLAPSGTPVTTGTVLFHHDSYPVAAIEGDSSTTPALTRVLSTSSSDGVDVHLLETMLAAGGFDPDGAMVVDDHFDDATAAAVQRWWAANGVTVDAAAVKVPAGSFIVVPGGLFVGDAKVAEGTIVARDTIVLDLTTAARQITTTAPVGDSTFVVGAPIDVLFPDGTETTSNVVTVGNVASSNSNNPNSTPTVPITLNVAEVPAAYDNFVQIPVTLRVVAQQAKGALVVPVSALVALAEGGFAVEVVDATAADGTDTTRLVGVTPGIYADGFVSITGDQLAEGMDVVVPS